MGSEACRYIRFGVRWAGSSLRASLADHAYGRCNKACVCFAPALRDHVNSSLTASCRLVTVQPTLVGTNTLV